MYNTHHISESALKVLRRVAVHRFVNNECVGLTDLIFKDQLRAENDVYPLDKVIDREAVRRLFNILINSDEWESLFYIFVLVIVVSIPEELKDFVDSAIANKKIAEVEKYIFDEMKLYLRHSVPRISTLRGNARYLEFSSVQDFSKFFICLELRNCASEDLKNEFLQKIWRKEFREPDFVYLVSNFRWCNLDDHMAFEINKRRGAYPNTALDYFANKEFSRRHVPYWKSQSAFHKHCRNIYDEVVGLLKIVR